MKNKSFFFKPLIFASCILFNSQNSYCSVAQPASADSPKTALKKLHLTMATVAFVDPAKLDLAFKQAKVKPGEIGALCGSLNAMMQKVHAEIHQVDLKKKSESSATSGGSAATGKPTATAAAGDTNQKSAAEKDDLEAELHEKLPSKIERMIALHAYNHLDESREPLSKALFFNLKAKNRQFYLAAKIISSDKLKGLVIVISCANEYQLSAFRGALYDVKNKKHGYSLDINALQLACRAMDKKTLLDFHETLDILTLTKEV